MNNLSSTVALEPDKLKFTFHYNQRFAERVSKKSKRASYFATIALNSGINADEIKLSAFRKELQSRQNLYGSVAKIYHGFVYWFNDNHIVTVWQIPRQFRNKLGAY